MTADELAVCTYLKSFPGQYVSGKEVCRRAGGKRRAMDEPRWAIPVLRGLVEQRIVESDATGHFRLIEAKPKDAKKKKWVSPQVYRLLKASGKNFDGVYEINTPLDSIPSLRQGGARGRKKDAGGESGQGQSGAGPFSGPGGSVAEGSGEVPEP